MKRILAVDDEEGIRRAIVFALRKIATVTTASNGAEAMALMKGGERFDCVVLDLDMPKASGAEVVSWMKSVDERRGVPIVMLTAYESSDLERLFEPLCQTGRVDSHRGVGLGLAICKRIVERHAGCIEVNSIVGLGTTFTFTIPGQMGGPEL